MFKYGDIVKVKEGFYKDAKGILVDIVHQKGNPKYYEAELCLFKPPMIRIEKNVIFEESELEKIEKDNLEENNDKSK